MSKSKEKEGSHEKEEAPTLRYRFLNLLRMGSELFRQIEANSKLGAFIAGLKVAGLASLIFFPPSIAFIVILRIEIDIIRTFLGWLLIFGLCILGGLPDHQRKKVAKERGF